MKPESLADALKGQQPGLRKYGIDEGIHPMQIAAFRRMTTGQKLDALAQMYKMGRSMLANQVRRQHPDWDAATVEREVSRRFANGIS